jgi:hypothetical protein
MARGSGSGRARRVPENAPWGMLPAVLRNGSVDRVELKALLDEEFENALAVLGPEVDPPCVRRIHYLDTPGLALLGRGVVVRARTTEGRGEDVVVKIRRDGPHGRLRRAGLAVELDALPGEVTWAASLRHRPARMARAIERPRPVRHLLSRAQRELLCSAARDEVDLDDLVVLGPVDVVRLTSGGRDDRICVELWTLPDSTRLLELSAKCRPARSPAVASDVRALIADHGIALAPLQATKTQLSLRMLASALDPAGGLDRS